MHLLRRLHKIILGLSFLVLLLGVWGWFAGRNPRIIPAPLPVPNPNGFDLYNAAASAIVPANPPVDEINDRQAISLSPQQKAARYTPERRAKWVAQNQKAWDLMKKALQTPCRHPNSRTLMPIGFYRPLRELARCKTIQTKSFKAQNQWDKAAQSGLDTLQMGHDIERGANVSGSLVAMAVSAIGDMTFDDLPAHLTAPEARRASQRLEALIASGEKPSQILTEEKWSSLTIDRQAFNNPNNPALAQGFATLMQRLMMPESVTTTLMDSLIAEADKPVGLQKPPTRPTGLRQIQAQSVFDTFARMPFFSARRDTRESLLLLRLALRAFYVEKGHYPATLQELAPTYLQKIPSDSFGKGEALRYKVQGDSYVLWSIGPDQKDQKGTPIPPKKPGRRAFASPDSLGDIVARP